MREFILKQLRELSRVRGKETTWVSELNDDQLYVLFLRLRNGETSKSIGRFIQDAWGVNPGSSVHSISQGVGKFKRRIAHLLISPTPCEAQNIFMDPLSDGSPDSGNSLESLDYIVRLHRERIMKMLTEEKSSGIKYPFLNRDIQALASLEKILLKAKSFAISHDHQDPIKKRKTELLQKNIDKNFRGMMNRLGEEGRESLIEAMDRFLELAEKEAEVLEISSDGELRIVKPEKS